MKFTKMQGAGNDYVVIETGGNQHNWSQLALVLCNRHFGIGADSLLLVMPSEKADFRMRIFDTDGSEAEACGNGIRCLTRYVWEKGLVSRDRDQIIVETMAGIRTLKLKKRNGKLETIQANMGEPLFKPAEIPVSVTEGQGKLVDIKSVLSYTAKVAGREMTLNLVSMGNPHAVFFQREPVVDFPLAQIGPRIENLKIFPNRVNFEVARVLDRKQIEARVWERGVGETLACGTGACAILVAAHKLDYTDEKIEVRLPGGTLAVEWPGCGEVMLSGPAEIVFTGEWPDQE